ncbi:MAG: ArsR family transcriptional regulator [Acinetobacter sp.]|nr:MAG: ArsR family transcriptional regulator [Acinetobacter sp.]
MLANKEIIPAKACYEHVGGKLGQLLMKAFIENKWIAKENPSAKHFYVTDFGKKEFAKIGVNLSEINLRAK